MEEVYQSSNYQSVWRPLARESDLSKINTSTPSSGAETKFAGVETVKKNSVEKPAERNETFGQNDVLEKLAKISTDINLLNHMLLDQQAKMDQLLGLLEEKEASDKKSVFGLLRK